MQTLGSGFTWEQLSPGQQFRTFRRTVTETDLVLFTGNGDAESTYRPTSAEGAIQGQFVPAALTYKSSKGCSAKAEIRERG
jgi:hypothetical protein